ncbi:MAG: HIRAN domain-containing protein [Oscillospiraceae bacterium]|nr:HIRAN domain-containing protein [Oscillospiraceae bacterium]
MNDIALQDEKSLILKNSGDLSDLIKPLSREIHLFDSYIAGTAHTDRALLDALSEGDRLDLRSERNKFEEQAVAVYHGTDKIGYIPEKDVIIFYRLLDAGKALMAKVADIDRSYERLAKIRISIYLIDF